MQQSWNVINAQSDLQRRRGNGNGRLAPIGKIQVQVSPGVNWVEAPPLPPPVRTYERTALDGFTFAHLKTEEQRERLQGALDKARGWLAVCQQQPGVSFLITGPVGTGKTTIADNLMRPFRHTVGALLDEGDRLYVARLRQQCDRVADDTLRQQIQQAIADFERFMQPQEMVRGRLLGATELMRVTADQVPLSHSFGRCDVIIVDDAGREDFSTPTYTPSDEASRLVRHNRYGRFVDFCYNAKKHVLVTSNTPLLASGGDQSGINPAFIDIFGEVAFDRLYQMSKGFMVDLSGLPSYRPYAVAGV